MLHTVSDFLTHSGIFGNMGDWGFIEEIYKIIFGGLLKIEKFCKLFFIADSNDSFAFDGNTFHSSTEYGHPDSFSSLSSSLYTFSATKHMQTCASILRGVKWNIGLTSKVPFVIRNDRSTFHRF